MILRNVSMHSHYLESLLKHRLLAPTPRSSDSGGLEWVLRIYISIKFPGDALSAGLGTALRNPLL